VLRLTEPTEREIEREVMTASQSDVMSLEHLDASGGVCKGGPRSGFVQDFRRTQIGEGIEAFEAAVQAFRVWEQFDLGWVRVANPRARIEVGQIIAVEVRSLGLWSVNLSQIAAVIRTKSRFGFIYKTTRTHVEEGEERFEVKLDLDSGAVCYVTQAVSHPRNWLAWVGYPVTRTFQHRFARDSHRKMRDAVRGGAATRGVESH
jgi:uncharacterized protein (UPF0548 family)